MADINDEVLKKLRRRIDLLDRVLFFILEIRFLIVKKVGARKKEKSFPIRDLTRESEVITKNKKRTNLPGWFVEKQMKLLIETAIEMEEEE